MQKLQEAFRFIKKQEYDLAIVVLSDDGKEYAQVKIEAEVKVKIIIKNLIFFQKKVVIFYFIPFLNIFYRLEFSLPVLRRKMFPSIIKNLKQ